MPREHRKRGKKHKKNAEPKEEPVEEVNYAEEGPQAGPSWIVQGDHAQEDVNPEAPFGYVDPDVKAYFRTVDEKLKEWQENKGYANAEEELDVDPNEERRLFVVAALTELSGKEKQLACDPDCSTVLERMAHSMDDFVKRVFLDRLAGSFQQLSRHRFASHVVQEILDVSRRTLHREAKGNVASASESNEGEGTLPTITQLIVDICEELLPSTPSLIMDPFASHILRAIFFLIYPPLARSTHASGPNQAIRSKKSEKYKSKQGPMRSVFNNGTSWGDTDCVDFSKFLVPDEVRDMGRKFVAVVRDALDPNEVRALAADKVACPVLAFLLEMEHIEGESDTSGSLMDSVSCGLITACLQEPPTKTEPSDYIATLLRDPASSHLLETLVSFAPEAALNVMWDHYFGGKLSKLAVHPVANFVVARVISRLGTVRLGEVVSELEGSWPKIIKNARIGVLRAIIDRVGTFSKIPFNACEAMATAFGLSKENNGYFVSCVLCLLPYTEYRELEKRDKDSSGPKAKSSLEPTTQGSLLLQSMLKLPEPHNQLVVESLLSLNVDDTISFSRSPISSHVLDSFLESHTVPSRSKRKFLLSLIGHYHTLVDDRIGSRVGDRCWATADPYLKEKIAKSMFVHEQALAESFFGRFFARNLNLYLLKKDPEAWKSMQVSKALKTVEDSSTVASSKPPQPQVVMIADAQSTKKRKRKREPKAEDEIDAVFSSNLGKKAKKGSLATTPAPPRSDQTDNSNPTKTKSKSGDKDLDTVFGAIRSAPKDLKAGGRKR